MIKVMRYQQHLIFNKRCYDNKLIPKAIKVKPFDNLPVAHKAAKDYSLKVIKIRIDDCKSKINYWNKIVSKHFQKLQDKLPQNIINMLVDRANQRKLFEMNKLKTTHINKFDKITKHSKQNRHAKSPSAFNNLDNEWVKILCTRQFDQYELDILKLDPKYQVVPSFIKNEEIIAIIEPKLQALVSDQATLESIRHKLINCLLNKNHIKPNLSKEHLSALYRLLNYQDIVITNADKGNTTVVIDKIEYNSKIMQVLSDVKFYKELKKDKTETIANKLITKMKLLLNSNLISYRDYCTIYPNEYRVIGVSTKKHHRRFLITF